jgi:uncharacterized protein
MKRQPDLIARMESRGTRYLVGEGSAWSDYDGGRGVVLLLVSLALALIPSATVAAQVDEPVVIGTTTTLRSEVLEEDRRLLIYLPNGYEQPTERYPVLYRLAGPAHFHHVTGTIGFLARAARIPPMIVVGIANTDRDRDTKPAANVTRFTAELPHFQATVTIDYPSGAGADRFLRFLTEELAPHIDGLYRTADFRLLVGHSSGGLFTLHALLSRPEAFNAFIASSPSLWWDEEALVKQAVAGPLPDFGAPPRFLYMAMGDEGASMIGPMSDLATALGLADPADLRWWYRLMPAESHVSMPYRTIYDALETIFSDYAIPESMVMAGDVTRLERHLAGAAAQCRRPARRNFPPEAGRAPRAPGGVRTIDLTGRRVLAEPLSQVNLLQLASGQGEDDVRHVGFFRVDAQTVETEEDIHRLEGHPFVAINEGVIPSESKTIGCCEIDEVSLGLVVEPISGAVQGGIEETLVSQPKRSAVLLHLTRMDRANHGGAKPPRLVHFESSRIALRYCLAPSS